MSLKRITAPTTHPLTLAQVKEHLRVDVDDEDTLIAALLDAAIESAEHATSRALMPQTWELALDAFPAAFELTRVPVSSIVSLKYVDTTGSLIQLASNAYVLDNASDHSFAYVVPAYGTTWPETLDQVNAVTLRYTAGYDSAALVPDSVKAWIKLQVGAMYANREAEGTVQTYALGFSDRLLDRAKVWG